MQTAFQTGVFWFGFACMVVGAIAFFLNVRRARGEGARQQAVNLFFVPLIAAALYLGLALGQGYVTVPDRVAVDETAMTAAAAPDNVVEGGDQAGDFDQAGDRTVHFLRYITWFFTTPLLLSQLARLSRAPTSLLLSLIFADMFMIATGGVAELSPRPLNYIWYLVSTGAFLAILYIVYVELGRLAKASPEPTQRLFNTLRLLTVVTWVSYPLVWILGTAGFGLYGANVQTLFYMILDVTSKVGFGFVALASWAAVEQLSQLTDAETEVAGRPPHPRADHPDAATAPAAPAAQI